MLLRRGTSVDALLHYTAAVFVAGNFYAFCNHGLVDELVVKRSPSEEDFLNYMIAVNVFCKLLHSVFQKAGE